MTDVPTAVGRLLHYLVKNELVATGDLTWARNRILEVMALPDYDLAAEVVAPGEGTIDDLLRPLVDDLVGRGIIAIDTAVRRDLWDTAIMGAVLAPPTATAARFEADLVVAPEAATDRLYADSIASNYIRKARTDRNPQWTHRTRYGTVVMTINLSKPEKDPRDIAAAADEPTGTTYPTCLLCRENEGYAGRLDHPARQNLRLVPLTLTGEPWFMQFSPYLYYPQHCIFLSEEHRPMAISRAGVQRLFEIVTTLPHYFVGSNADLPIVGGSILTHDHFQGGRFDFPLQHAGLRRAFSPAPGVSGEVLDWPLSTVRLTGADPAVITDSAMVLIDAWRHYDDPANQVLSHTGNTRHNTVTPIARRSGGDYQVDLVLRNNRTSAEFPLGIFHPHSEIHPIKRENIGLIEVMGLAVLPGRLAEQLDRLAEVVRSGRETPADLSEHSPMIEPLRGTGADQAAQAVRAAVADYFVAGLEHCGVFGTGESLDAGMGRFLETMGWA